MKFLFVWLIMALFLLSGCEQSTEPKIEKEPVKPRKDLHFLQQVNDSGIDFIHNNSMQGDFWPHEILGPGAGVVDVDGDGDLDIYFRQGSSDNDVSKSDQVFINQWIETGVLKFIVADQKLGIKNFGYGMGITFGDIDNDGDEDIFLTNYGIDVMLENQSGKFIQVAGPWETAEWSTSATFIDFNRDGWLDLYVGKYNQYQLGNDVKCFNQKSQTDYCSPKSYPLEYDSLYLNQQGKFIDVSEQSGIKSDLGYTLAVVVEDFNADGWPDILTANDATQNLLWMNQQDGTFVNEGLVRGIAVNGKGEMEASMGIAVADFDHDLDWDFVMTHLATESNTFYVNNGSSYFMDQSNKTNMVQLSKKYTAFGIGWLDVNNDQLEDLIILNGAVNSIPEQRQSGDPFPLKQQQQVLLLQADQRFVELQDIELPFLNTLMVGRSAVFADLDNDGDKDMIVTINNEAPVMLENTSPEVNWLGLNLVNSQAAQALGSSVLVTFSDDSQEIKRFHNDGSYLSGNDPRILIKWQGNKQLKQIDVTWPSGEKTSINQFTMNQYQQVTKSDS